MKNQANTYLEQQVRSASQEELLIMLYDGAIRFLMLAKLGLEEKNIEKFHNNNIKAQNIISEFMSTLDMEMGGEVAKNLFKLYEYLHFRLVQSNLKKNVSMLNEVLTHLRDLKKTWEKAIVIARAEKFSTQLENNAQLDDNTERKNVYSA